VLIYFMAICNVLRPFGIFEVHWVHIVLIGYIFQFWYHVPRKIWHTWSAKSYGVGIGLYDRIQPR
jgi:hypothetical protein